MLGDNIFYAMYCFRVYDRLQISRKDWIDRVEVVSIGSLRRNIVHKPQNLPRQNYDKSCYYLFAIPGFHPSLLFMSGLLSIGLKKFQNFIQRSIPLPTQAHLRLSLISDLGSNAIFEICGSAIELLRIGLRLESQPVRECYMGRENFKTLCNQRILVTLVKWVRRNAQNCLNC